MLAISIACDSRKTLLDRDIGITPKGVCPVPPIELRPSGEHLVHVRTGRRGALSYVGCFGTLKEALEAAEKACAGPPRALVTPKPKARQTGAEDGRKATQFKASVPRHLQPPILTSARKKGAQPPEEPMPDWW